MSQLFVDNIKNRTGGAIGAPSGVVVTGVVTATSFVGDGTGLVGVASTDNIITGTAATFTGGINAAQSDVSVRNLTGVAATFTGVLTYEDVTNIDSVGLITARSGIRIGAGQSVSAVSGIVTYYGDGSQLTGVESGVSNFVASGTIANGATVIIKADGTVDAVTQTGSATPAIGTAVEIHPTLIDDLKIAYDSNSNRVVVAYTDDGNSSYGTARLGTVNASDNSISFGPEYVFRNNTVNVQSLIFNPDDNKFLVCYSTGGSPASQVKVLGADVANNTITSNGTGGENEFTGNYAEYSRISYDTQNDKLVCIWRNSNQSDRGDVKIGTISGNLISYAGTNDFGSSINGPNLIYTKDGKTVVVFKNSSNKGAARVGSLSGTSMTWGGEAEFEQGNCSSIDGTYDSTNEKVVVAYSDSDDYNYGKAAVGTITNNDIVWGTPVTFDGTGSINEIAATFDTVNGKVIITYANGSSSGKAVIGTVSGTGSNGTINFGSGLDITFESSSHVDHTACTFDSTGERVVIAYIDTGNSGQAKSVVYSSTSFTTNLTTENYIGIAAEAIANAATGKVNILGGVNSGQTGLTTAKTYFVQPTGTLATSAGNPSVVAGTSISDTKILIR